MTAKRSYQLARDGEKPEPKARPATVHSLECERFEHPEFDLKMTVSTGTYVRSIVRDLGEQLKTGAYCLGIRRTRIGQFLVEKAVTFEQLDSCDGKFEDHILSMADVMALTNVPAIKLTPEQKKRILHGNPVMTKEADFNVQPALKRKQPIMILDARKNLIAIGSARRITTGNPIIAVEPEKVLIQG